MSEAHITYLLQNKTDAGEQFEGKTSRKMQVTAEGDFDGATATLQTRPNANFTYKPLTFDNDGSPVEVTDEVSDLIIDGIARRNDIRAFVTNPGVSTDITLAIQEVEQ